jgi:hypothetical protein
VRDRGRAEKGEIFSTAQKAGSHQTIMVLVGRKRTVAGALGHGDFDVAGFIILAQRSTAIPFALDVVLDAETLQLVSRFLRTVCDIRVKRCFVTEQQGIPLLAVVNIASSDCLAMDEAVFIDTSV